jgi:hypothetical protein
MVGPDLTAEISALREYIDKLAAEAPADEDGPVSTPGTAPPWSP